MANLAIFKPPELYKNDRRYIFLHLNSESKYLQWGKKSLLKIIISIGEN